MIYQFDDEHGQGWCMGVGRIIKAPKFGRSKKGNAYCILAIEVERYRTGNKTPEGYPEEKNTVMSMTAFGDLAKYCKNLEKKDVILFAGRTEIDEYWTSKSETGEVSYKCVLEFAVCQDSGRNGGYADYPGELPDGFEDIPDY